LASLETLDGKPRTKNAHASKNEECGAATKIGACSINLMNNVKF